MPYDDLIDSFAPTRSLTGLSNPNYQKPQAPQQAEHGFLQPHERTQYFEDNPQQALGAFSGLFGTGNQKRRIQDSLGPIMDSYLGNLGQSILGGESPQGGFVDYLGGTRGYEKPFDFQSFYHQQFPGAGARDDAQSDPSIRYLY